MISGLVLKYLNGECFVICGFYKYTLLASTEFNLTVPTVVLAPIHYTLLIWGTTYGWIVFGHFPDKWTWFGSAIIFATGVYVVLREWSKKNQR